MKKFKFAWVLPVLLCLLSAHPAAAAQTGSLRLTVEGAPGLEICLHYVADDNGTLTAEFSNAGITPGKMSDETELATNASQLRDYAVEHSAAGMKKAVDAAGNADYTGLAEGCYLVYCVGNTKFEPFLLLVPTTINGEAVYDIQAEPKSCEGGLDTVTPTPPSEPNIPQTGSSVLPQYLLLALGIVTAGAGVAELAHGRRETCE